MNGLINHGLRKRELLVFLPNNVTQGPNFTLNIIYKHLYNVFTNVKYVRAPVLHIQADNCWKENKNKYTMYFCALLIHWGWFDVVHLSFLPVGHTHEDIDRLFSNIRTWMPNVNWDTADDFLKNIPKAYPTYKSTISAIKQPNLYGWKSWMKMHLLPMVGISTPHAFKFQKSTTRQVFFSCVIVFLFY